MNLRTKTFFIISAIFICAFLVLAVVLRTFILNGYIREENQSTTEKVQQVQKAISDSGDNLKNILDLDAIWTSTYQFVQDKNTNYTDSNFADTRFFNDRLNLVAILDTNGNVIYSKAFGLVNGKQIAVPDSLKNYLTSDSPLLIHSDSETGVNGLISLPESPMLVASHPILTSQGNAPMKAH